MVSKKNIAKVQLIKQPHGGALRPPMKKGETMNPNGRPKNLVNALKESLELEFDITTNKSTVRTLLGFLAYLPRSKIEEIHNDVTMPIAIRLFTRSLRKDWDTRSTDTVKGLISFEMAPGNEPPPAPTSLAQFSKEDVLTGIKHGIFALDIEGLELVDDMVQKELQKKRSMEAKIING